MNRGGLNMAVTTRVRALTAALVHLCKAALWECFVASYLFDCSVAISPHPLVAKSHSLALRAESSFAGSFVAVSMSACPPPTGQVPETYDIAWKNPIASDNFRSECAPALQFCRSCFLSCLLIPAGKQALAEAPARPHPAAVHTGDTFNVRWDGAVHNLLPLPRTGNADRISLDQISCQSARPSSVCSFVIPDTYSCGEVVRLHCSQHPNTMFLTIALGNATAQAAPVPDPNRYRIAHGVAMFLAFGFFLPIGGFLAQSGRIKCGCCSAT